MSHSSSPNNRSSIFGWVKNLKRGNLVSNESVNELYSDNEMSLESRSPTKSISGNIMPHHSSSQGSHQDFLRPLLQHKSISANNVNRVRSNSFNQIDRSPSIRAHRDSFLQHNPLVDENSKYFGVSLEDATSQAAAKISILTNDTSDQVLQYGKIPIVVAKCGVYLKQNGLNVEGIFRVGGSSKRVKELQAIFNSAPDFGKKLNWDGYTVHDAASILRRYLNALPEPLIPLDLYEAFRDPLRSRQRIISYLKFKAENPGKIKKPTESPRSGDLGDSGSIDPSEFANSQPLTEANIGLINSSSTKIESPPLFSQSLTSQENIKSDGSSEKISVAVKSRRSKNYKKLTNDIHEAIDEYKILVDALPNLSKQLLFYILDLLAMVQNSSSENLMSSRNLAAIFQPSILSHPSHDLDPVEYALSQYVVEFLISYAYKLLPNQIPPQATSNTQTEISNPVSVTEDSNSKSESTKHLGTSGKRSRPHSKSLSYSSNNEELIGFQKSSNSNPIPMIDSDQEFEITDDENDGCMSDEEIQKVQKLTLNDELSLKDSEDAKVTKTSGSIANPNVEIIVSTPSASLN